MLKDEIEVPRLLVVSRDSALLRPLWSMGESNGWLLEIAADPWEAIDKAQSGLTLDLLLLDRGDDVRGGEVEMIQLIEVRPYA